MEVQRAIAIKFSVLFFLNIKILMLMVLVPLSMSYADELKPFSSDGCSAFPDGTLAERELWLKCCTEHDYAYWKGGSYQQRVEADMQLKNCVAEVGEEAVALVMLAGVRVGGSPFFPTRFRWGYGWSYPKFYGALTPKELERIKFHNLDARHDSSDNAVNGSY